MDNQMDDSEVNTPTENNKTTMPPPNHIPNEANIFNNLSERDNSTAVSGSVSPQIMVDANQPYTPVQTPDTGLGGPSQSKSRRNLVNNPDQNNDHLETMSTNSGQTINSRKNHKNRPSSPDNETLNHILNQINCYDEPKRLKILQKIFNEMSHYSLSQVEGLLTPMLQRDFISMLPLHGVTNIAEEILTYLDAGSLSAAEQVSPAWKQVIMKGFLWKRLIERKIKEDTMWCGLAEREEDEWGKFFERAIQQAHAKNTRKNHPTYKSRRQKLAEKEARDKKDGNTADNTDKKDETSDKKDEISSSTPKTDNIPSSSTPIAANPLASAASANSLAGGDNNTLSRNNTGNSADVSNLPLSAQALIAQANSLDVLEVDTPNQHEMNIDEVPTQETIDKESEEDRKKMLDEDDDEIDEIINNLDTSIDMIPDDEFFEKLYPEITKKIAKIESNWAEGKFTLSKIQCKSETSKGVYCLQYDNEKIVSGLRDNTIKIYDRKTLQPVKCLSGHTGSVLCLQYDDQVIITGSSDSTVRVWDVNTGEILTTLVHHCEAVLHLRFANGMMVTCSKDRSIAIWDMISPRQINMRRVLIGHRAAVNVVDFDMEYIVSASGDRTIKVWNTGNCEFVRTLQGHRRGIACLQYRNPIVVSGSSDNCIRIWNIKDGKCCRSLEGHEELVRCIRFDDKRIVSGAYDGRIKVWGSGLKFVELTRSPPKTPISDP